MNSEKKMEAPELCKIIDNDNLYNTFPYTWMVRIDSYINSFESSEFWTKAASMDCLASACHETRFFPIDEKTGEMAKIAKWVFDEAYPDWNDKKTIKNQQSPYIPKHIKLNTNYSFIPVMNPYEINKTINIEEIKTVLRTLRKIEGSHRFAKLLYYLCIKYETCHLAIKDQEISDYIVEMLHNKEFTDIIRHGLFYTFYIIKHEERTAMEKTANNRFMLTHQDVARIARYHNGDLNTTPLITHFSSYGTDIYSNVPYYLNGNRIIADTDTFRERLSTLTNSIVTPIIERRNAYIVGSKILSALVDNSLCIVPRIETKRDSDGNTNTTSIKDITDNISRLSDINSIKYRDNIYFPRDGETALVSDLDIAIVCESFDEFMTTVSDIYDELAKTHDVEMKDILTPGGVKYHIMDRKTKLKLEIFKSQKSVIELVSKFHVSAVRMFYNIDGLHMTLECATSLITGVGQNYNWLSSSKLPMEIILKYAQRGHSTILNTKELLCIQKFMQTNERWKYPSNLCNFIGAFSNTHPFFRIDAEPRGIRYGMSADGTIIKSLYYDNIYKKSIQLRYKGNNLIRNKGMRINPPTDF